jgi:membrane-bound metal-dependent hydrolase YbcI (DUF457 family)
MWVFGALAAFTFGVAASLPLGWLLLAICAAAVIGRITGRLLLNLLRFVSGGHRRLTHSLVLGISLFVLAGVLYGFGLPSLAFPSFAIAWGQFLHLIGDVVTPGGVPLFYPLWSRNIHLFPHSFTRFGEPIIFMTALLVGFVFIWV